MDHAKRLYLIDEFDREYKRVQCPSAIVAKARSAELDDMLRSTKLDDHENARQYVAELHLYLNVTASPPAARKRAAAATRKIFPPPPACRILGRKHEVNWTDPDGEITDKDDGAQLLPTPLLSTARPSTTKF